MEGGISPTEGPPPTRQVTHPPQMHALNQEADKVARIQVPAQHHITLPPIQRDRQISLGGTAQAPREEEVASRILSTLIRFGG